MTPRRKPREFLSLLLLLLVAPCLAGAEVGSGEGTTVLAAVPLEISDRLPIVKLRIDGEGPFAFFVNTGAAETALRHTLVERLGLTALGPGSLGGQIDGERVRAASVRLGDLEITDVELLSIDFSQITGDDEGPDGVLGFGLLSQYLWTLDYAAGRLEISEGALPATGSGILEFQLEGDADPSISIEVAGHPLRARLDPSEFGGLVLPGALMDELPLASPAGKIGRTGNAEGMFDLYGARLEGELRFGGVALSNPRVVFSEAYASANLGYRALEEFALTFDTPNRRVRFERKQSVRVQQLHDRAAAVKGLEDTPDLQTAFNAEPDKVRMLLILSPT